MSERILDWFADHVFGWVMILAFALLIGSVAGVCYAVWADWNSESFELKKDAWECTKSHPETSYIWAGKVMMPVSRTECDQWSRK